MRKSKHWRMGIYAASMSLGAVAASAQAGSLFDSGNLAVVRVVTNASAIEGNEAAAVVIDEYDAMTGALIASHPINSSGADALTLSQSIDHDGHLNLSADGRYLVIAGYRADAGASNPVYDTAADTSRVIGLIDASWNIDTSTALGDAYSQTRVNAVVSVDGTSFWTVGEGTYTPDPVGDPSTELPSTTGGLRYVAGVGATSSVNVSQTSDTVSSLEPDSIRSARIMDGHIYINTASPESFGSRGTYVTSDTNPLPTSSATATVMQGVITNMEGTKTAYDYDGKGKTYPKTDSLFFDLDPSIPGVDTAYGTGGKNMFEKFSLVDIGGGNYEWQPVGVGNKTASLSTFDIYLPNDSDEILAMDGGADANGDVTLFLSTAFGIYRYIDGGGYNGVFSNLITTDDYFITAGDDQFAGVAMLNTTVPEPASVAMLAIGGLAIIRRRRRA